MATTEDMMCTVQTSITDHIAVVTLTREKVNAINGTLLSDLNSELDRAEADGGVDSIVLTGREKFFSFGFDVPELLAMSRSELTSFLTDFTATLLRLFTLDIPIIAAVNGHATAGGCMLVMACDYRVAAESRARIGLNEVDLGVSVFRGPAEMLRYWVGERSAELILHEGTMYSIAAAERLGMVDEVVPPAQLLERAIEKATELGGKPKVAYRALKQLMRGATIERIVTGEHAALDAFLDTWYTDEAPSILAGLPLRK